MPEEILPPHFYGELAKTELGCTVLGEKGHFVEFAMFIRQHGQETEDAELILKLKSILWAVVSGVFSGLFVISINCQGQHRSYRRRASVLGR
jgi:hypothetical protein